MPDEPDINALFGTFRSTRFTEGSDPNRVPQSSAPGTGNPQPTGWIQDGVVTASSLDTTAPAAPTGLTLTSDVVINSDATSYVRLLVGLVQPADSDLFGSYVEVTANNDGAGNPVWDRPVVILIGESQTQNRVENVQGNTQYWGRARAVDILGNFSAYTSTVTHTTTRDQTAPSVPTGVTVTAGFRGFGAYWVPATAADLMFYQYRRAPDLSGAPDTAQWVYAETIATTIFVANLLPNVTYWFQVRAVDTSGNVATSISDATAVQYQPNPEAGWTTALSVVPTLVGAADLAVNSVSAASGHIADLNADKFTAGTMTLTPTTGPTAIKVNTAGGVTTVQVLNDGTAKFFDQANPNRYLVIDSGQFKFTLDGGATFTTGATPDGFYGDAVKLGSLPGGHNLIRNSSFELYGYVAVASTAIFTSDVSTPGWKAANRTTAPDNVTESTALTVTTLAY
jgi:hypothetical protein